MMTASFPYPEHLSDVEPGIEPVMTPFMGARGCVVHISTPGGGVYRDEKRFAGHNTVFECGDAVVYVNEMDYSRPHRQRYTIPDSFPSSDPVGLAYYIREEIGKFANGSHEHWFKWLTELYSINVWVCLEPGETYNMDWIREDMAAAAQEIIPNATVLAHPE
jgi:hypothetical protein